MVHWMRVGFVHGVINTDDMSILGLGIELWPYGWVNDFDPAWTPTLPTLPGGVTVSRANPRSRAGTSNAWPTL